MRPTAQNIPLRISWELENMGNPHPLSAKDLPQGTLVQHPEHGLMAVREVHGQTVIMERVSDGAACRVNIRAVTDDGGWSAEWTDARPGCGLLLVLAMLAAACAGIRRRS